MQTNTPPCRIHVPDDCWDGRVTRAEINLDAVRHNIKSLMRLVGEGTKFMAVVKANAYGHGAVPVAQIAEECGVHCLGVACTDEGVQLRRAGIRTPILVLSYSQPLEMKTCVQFGLTPTVNDAQVAEVLEHAAASMNRKVAVHLKVDSGMNRFGLHVPALIELATTISSMPHLEMEGLYTHFARSDEADRSWTNQQFEYYLYARDMLRKAGFEFPVCHTANSAAAMDMPETRLDMIRCGTTLYGMYPSPTVSHIVELQRAMTVKSNVARVHDLKPGDGVSYGYTFVAARPTKVALIPIGYGDGYRRALSNIAPVLIHGKRAFICGRICMDQTVINVSDIDDVELGDEVVLIGRQGDNEVSAEALGSLTGTINYEVTTWITARVPRLFFSGGRFVGYSDLNYGFSFWY